MAIQRMANVAMFAVDDLDDTLARLRPHGCEPLREVAN